MFPYLPMFIVYQFFGFLNLLSHPNGACAAKLLHYISSKWDPSDSMADQRHLDLSVLAMRRKPTEVMYEWYVLNMSNSQSRSNTKRNFFGILHTENSVRQTIHTNIKPMKAIPFLMMLIRAVAKWWISRSPLQRCCVIAPLPFHQDT